MKLIQNFLFCSAFLVGLQLGNRSVEAAANEACVARCKAPWQSCFRDACLSIKGFGGMKGAKRAIVEQEATQTCSPQWQTFMACQKSCN